jgi:hypothetical protein
MIAGLVIVAVARWATADAVITELAAARAVHKTVAVEAAGIAGGGAFSVVVRRGAFMLVVEPVAVWVEYKVAIAEAAVGAKVVVRAAFGVAVVGGVVVVVCSHCIVVNAVVVVVVAAGNLRFKLPQLRYRGRIGLDCFRIVGFLLFAVTIQLDFDDF